MLGKTVHPASKARKTDWAADATMLSTAQYA